MRILLTGATGYIGKRLLPALLHAGHEIVCCVRDKHRFSVDIQNASKVEIIELDFLEVRSLQAIPTNIDVAFYLMHSMSASDDYQDLELRCAENFRNRISETDCKQVIYLSGIVNEDELSPHLASRKAVEEILSEGGYHLTTFRAGIIIGSGSASFEIIRDLVEKLPVMITPRWLNTRCQPIGIADVLAFLQKSVMVEELFDRSFDIGGPDILSYKEMLLDFASVRGLKRKIWTIPVMTPQLSSYWLYFVTSTSYKLAKALVNSMKVEVICRPSDINAILQIKPIGYKEALNRTLYKIQNREIISSWKDAWTSGEDLKKIDLVIEVPDFGVFVDKRTAGLNDEAQTIDKLWRIGGSNGWYYGTWLWKLRGIIDKIFGGVGLRRGRTHPTNLTPGDAIDFWRVLIADKPDGHLLLFAEMKLPGEAWLEFKVDGSRLVQTATFRPKGLLGRLYWYLVLPFHGLIFNGMLKALVK